MDSTRAAHEISHGKELAQGDPEAVWGLPAQRVRFPEARFEDCAVEGPFDAVIGSSILYHLDMEDALARILELLKPGGVMSFAERNMLKPQIVLEKNTQWLKAYMGDSPDETAFVHWPSARPLREVGFERIEIVPFDWPHPNTPAPLIGAVSRAGRWMERVPILREFAGALYIRSRRPR
jgi:SAM-dependent methyltransferase